MLTGGFLKVGITALTQGEFGIVQSSMVGSILSGTLLVRSPLFTSLPSFNSLRDIGYLPLRCRVWKRRSEI